MVYWVPICVTNSDKNTPTSLPPSNMRRFSGRLLISITVILACSCRFYASPICSHAACGGFSNITYPFGLAKSGCGHPDFQIECLDNRPLLPINNENYRILDYKSDSMVVADDRVFADCGMPDASLNLTGTPFNLIDPSLPNLTLLFGCKTDLLPSFIPVPCNTTWAATFRPWLPGYCKSIVRMPTLGVMPIMLNMTNIWLLLRSGFEIGWNENGNLFANCTACLSKQGICGYNNSDSGSPFLCYLPENTSSGNRSKGVSANKDVSAHQGGGGKFPTGIVAGVCVGVALAIAAAVTAIARQRRRVHRPPELRNPKGVELGLASHSVGVPLFSYEELEEATCFFDEKRVLGDGGFGAVYLGRLGDGRQVAVKRMYRDNTRRVQQFDTEVQILSSVRHPNLVRLIGFCQDHRELLLVYEYVPNGTLADHLHGDLKGRGLSWETRLNIALQTAQALSYLHFCVKPPIFHRDVKSSNILLDENFSAKVADFGLSRLMPLEASHVSTAPQGTPGYLDPDYNQCYRLTDKSDVYSFGVVLAEIISAKKAVDTNRKAAEISLANLAISKIQGGALHEFVDPRLEMQSNPLVSAMVHGVAELVFRCLALEKEDRPNMMEVVALLQQIKEIIYGCAQNAIISNHTTMGARKLADYSAVPHHARMLPSKMARTTPGSSAQGICGFQGLTTESK